MHLSVLMEGERQQRQLFVMLKDKSAAQIRELEDRLEQFAQRYSLGSKCDSASVEQPREHVPQPSSDGQHP